VTIVLEVRNAHTGDATALHLLLARAFAEYEGRLDPPSGANAETPASIARKQALHGARAEANPKMAIPLQNLRPPELFDTQADSLAQQFLPRVEEEQRFHGIAQLSGYRRDELNIINRNLLFRHESEANTQRRLGQEKGPDSYGVLVESGQKPFVGFG